VIAAHYHRKVVTRIAEVNLRCSNPSCRRFFVAYYASAFFGLYYYLNMLRLPFDRSLQRQCPCGYDMVGTLALGAITCPECGAELATGAANKAEFDLLVAECRRRIATLHNPPGPITLFEPGPPQQAVGPGLPGQLDQ
jgi:ribosomal protein L37AE/L43A